MGFQALDRQVYHIKPHLTQLRLHSPRLQITSLLGNCPISLRCEVRYLSLLVVAGLAHRKGCTGERDFGDLERDLSERPRELGHGTGKGDLDLHH